MDPKSMLGLALPEPQLNAQEQGHLDSLDSISDALRAQSSANDRAGKYPFDSISELKKAGLLTAPLPIEQNSHRLSLEIQFRLATIDSSVAQIYKVHDELVREIFQYAPDAQIARLSGLLADGQTMLGLAVAEAGKTAVDPLTTTAIPTEHGGFIVTGNKIYTTGAAGADHIATWGFNAEAATAQAPARGMQMLLIPQGTAGVTVHNDWDALGQRATASGAISFSEVHCPSEWVASVPGKAPLPQSSLRYQAGFAAILTGIGIGALCAAAPFVANQSRPWAATGVTEASADPMIQRQLGELASDLIAAYWATMACAPLLDDFELGKLDRGALAIPISCAKSAASRAAIRATAELHALMGTRSIAGSKDFDRWWRNARTLSLHDPVDWKNAEVGRHILTGWTPDPGIYQ